MKKKYQTGSNHLNRKPFFNQISQLDVDIPDGDIEIGKRVMKQNCLGCHRLHQHAAGPRLNNMFGKSAGKQKGFRHYSLGNKRLGYQWSKQRLFYLFQNPQEVLGLLTSMLFGGLHDPYENASLIEYMHYLRIHTAGNLVKPEWINQKFQ